MAKKTLVTMIDDVDGSEAAETLSFSIDGASYEIDLSAANASAFRTALKPYVDAGRRTSRPPARRTGAGGGTAKEVRAWAAERGIHVPPRGRIPGAVLDQYQAAHS